MPTSLRALPSIVLALFAAAASADGGRSIEPGPIRAQDQFALSAGFLAFDPVSADLLEAGEWRVEAVWTVGNTFAHSGAVELALEARESRGPITTDFLVDLAERRFDGTLVFADGELSRFVVALSRGFGRGIEVEVLVPVLSFGGGVLDSSIETFHDAFGISQAGRDRADRDEFRIFLRSKQGELVLQESPRSAIGDVVVGSKFRLLGLGESSWRLALEALIKLPTGGAEPLVSSGEIDTGVRLLLARGYHRWSVHASAGILRLGASRAFGLESQRLLSGMAAVERAIGERSSVLLQLSASESPFEPFDTSKIGSRLVLTTVGWKRALGDKNVLMIGVTENVVNFTNSSDLSLHLGIQRRF